jgi:hypothetical protein
MGAVSITFNGSIISGAEADDDGGTWDKWGATQSPAQEADFVWQGDYSISNKISNTTGGIDFDDDAPINYVSPRRVCIAKVMVTTTGLIDLTVAEGQSYQIGSGGSDYYNYYLSGLYAGAYPLTKSWRFVIIDPNEIAFRDAVVGTPSLTAVDYYGHWADISASSKSENVIHDRLDWVYFGQGLTLTGGDGADADGTFQDFLDYDYGTYTNRMGVVVPGEEEIIVNATLKIGGSTATVFDDANQILVFPHYKVGNGHLGINVDLANASNEANFTNCTFKGLGNASTKKFFDSYYCPGGMRLTVFNHGFNTGDLVLYSKEGGSHNVGLTDDTYYFVYAESVNIIHIFAVGSTVGRQNSFTNTSYITTTAGGGSPGENHSLIRVPDTRPIYAVSGTLGIGCSFDDCTIDGAASITITSTSGIDFEGGFILRTGEIIPNNTTFRNMTIKVETIIAGDSLFPNLTTLDNITGCDIELEEEGHAFELTASGSYSSNNTYTNFWNPVANSWQFHTVSGIDASFDYITTDGDTGFADKDIVYYNNEGGSDTIGLTNGGRYYIGNLTASGNTFSLHTSEYSANLGVSKINLTAGASGEIHSIYSGNAAIYNNSGGEVTINVAIGSSAPSVRNGTGATTTVQNSVDLDLKVIDENGDDVQYAWCYIAKLSGGAPFMIEQTLADGTATQPYPYVSDEEVTIRVRKYGYKHYVSEGLITAYGLSSIITLIADPQQT